MLESTLLVSNIILGQKGSNADLREMIEFPLTKALRLAIIDPMRKFMIP